MYWKGYVAIFGPFDESLSVFRGVSVVRFQTSHLETQKKSSFYRLQTRLRKGNVFTHVCHSVHGEDVHPPRQTPPETATATAGRHPTGMHSSFLLCLQLFQFIQSDLMNV